MIAIDRNVRNRSIPVIAYELARMAASDRLRTYAPPCGEAMGRWQREALTEGQ